MGFFDDNRYEWYEAMKAKGHMPTMTTEFLEEGETPKLDTFVMDADVHNGPGCDACGWSCCMHCTSISEIPQCTVMTMIPHQKKLT